jgi:hypothetical protein
LKNNPNLAKLASYVLSTNPTEDIIEKAHKFGLDNWSNRACIGVSDYLNLEHDLGLKGPGGLPVKSVLSPVYDKEKRIENSLTPEFIRNNGGTRAAAETALRRLISDEEKIAEIGTLEHALLEVMVKERTANMKAGSIALGTSNKGYLDTLSRVKACLENGVNLKGAKVDLMKLVDNSGALTVDQVVSYFHESIVQME